jgi:hypothetical protein
MVHCNINSCNAQKCLIYAVALPDIGNWAGTRSAGSRLAGAMPLPADLAVPADLTVPADFAVKVRVIRPVRRGRPAWTLRAAGIMTISIKFVRPINRLAGTGVDE